jgi:hypothetical protein
MRTSHVLRPVRFGASAVIAAPIMRAPRAGLWLEALGALLALAVFACVWVGAHAATQAAEFDQTDIALTN